jgi:SAM-dependent methyltransferase
MTSAPPLLFDRALLRRRRDRAAASLTQYDFMLHRAVEDILDRIESVVRDFPQALALGGAGAVGRVLAQRPEAAAKIGWLAQSDLSPEAARLAEGPVLAMDEEFSALADESLDLVIAPLGLHWTNDLPGALVQINRMLRPDGFFAAAFFGGNTLTELRQCLIAAESELAGGVAARVSPKAGAFDAASLLQRAGFALPVSDVDRATVRYAHMFDLMRDLRGMGETSILADRPRTPLGRAVFLRAAQIYAERFSDPDGRIRASFDIIHMAGWAPHPDQPKPKRPGSATHRLADALGAQEVSLGEKAGR